MNKKQILQRVARNAQMLGLSIVSQTDSLVVITGTNQTVKVACVDATIASPMGGIDGTSSPFLGIGIANPGQIAMYRGADGASLAKLFTDPEAVAVFNLLAHFANDIILYSHDGSTELLRVRGNVDLLGMGQ